MFHPIGSQPPSVYWRRRLMFAASLVLLLVLAVLTVKAVTSSGGATSAAGGSSASHAPATSRPASTPPTIATTSMSRSPGSSTPRSSTTGSSGASSKAQSSSAAAPPACTATQLHVAAVPQHASYRVGDQPVLQLRVTNTGPKPCVQDLADKQVVLLVYNGESRVWGSHDCKTVPGTDPRVLGPNLPVLVAINWSGLTSQSPCTGTRQRVGPGTYTLYGSLGGRTSQAGRFTIS